MNDRLSLQTDYADRMREERIQPGCESSPFTPLIETDRVTHDGHLLDVDWFFHPGGIELVKVTVADSGEGCFLRSLSEEAKDDIRAAIQREHNRLLTTAIDALVAFPVEEAIA